MTIPDRDTQPSIMIVDDDELLCKSLNLELKRYYDVTIVHTAESALEKLKHTTFDLMLIDIHLPGMDGVDLLRHVKKARPEIKIIIFTAFPALETYRSILKGDADDYLEKPVEPSALLASIDDLLDTPESSLFHQVCTYIEAHLDENITLESLSKAFHKTPKSFSRWFNRICQLSDTNHTFSTFLINLRMAKAKRLLRDTDLLVKEISAQVGYSNFKSFYHVFKQTTGFTADEYRKKNNELYRNASQV